MGGVIEVLSTTGGHEDLQLPESPQEAQAKVQELMQKGYSIFLSLGEGDTKQDKKVTGFDGETGEYLVKEETTLRFPAATAKATAVAPTAGG